VAVVAIVVEVIVAYYLGPEAAQLVGEELAPYVTTAAAAAAGNVAGQATANAIGIQHGFDGKSFAFAVLTQGSGGDVTGLGTAATTVAEKVGAQIVNGAVNNALQQGLKIALGIQHGFSWAQVAGAAIAAPVVSSLSDTLLGDSIDQATGKSSPSALTTAVGSTAANIISRSLNGIVSQTIVNQFTGGKLNYASIVTDAFGNAIGNSLGGEIRDSLVANQQEGQLAGAEQEVSALQRQQAMAAYGGGYGSNTSNGAGFGAGVDSFIDANTRMGTARQTDQGDAMFNALQDALSATGSAAGRMAGDGYDRGNMLAANTRVGDARLIIGTDTTSDANADNATADALRRMHENGESRYSRPASITRVVADVAQPIQVISNVNYTSLADAFPISGGNFGNPAAGLYVGDLLSQANAPFTLPASMAPAIMPTELTGPTLIAAQTGGALVGVAETTIDSVIGMGRMVYNGALSDLNHRSDGLLGSFIPHVAQADAAHIQLQQNLYNAVRSPIQTATHIYEGIAAQETQAQMLDARGMNVAAAQIRGAYGSSIGATLIGGAGAIRSVASMGAGLANGASTSGWTSLSSSVRSYIRDIESQTGLKISSEQRSLLADNLRTNEYTRLTPEEASKHRAAFNKNRTDLINAHHIIESSYGGSNEWWNIHPARFPDQHQGGIHRANGPARSIFDRDN